MAGPYKFSIKLWPDPQLSKNQNLCQVECSSMPAGLYFARLDTGPMPDRWPLAELSVEPMLEGLDLARFNVQTWPSC